MAGCGMTRDDWESLAAVAIWAGVFFVLLVVAA